MDMISSLKLVQKYGINVADYKIAKDEIQAVQIAKQMKCPVAVKVISDNISHKSDVGGVRINLKNKEMVELVVKDMKKRLGKYGIKGFLIQKMGRKGLELIVGGKKDPQFGDMIVLGLGGIYVEVFKDITARICPIEDEDVMEMINELKSHPIIMGTRGKKAIHIKSLITLIKTMCKMMKKEQIKEIDLNPVLFNDKGYDVVDVRIVK